MFKRLVKSSLILIGVAFSCPGFSAAAEETDLGRYWAGHKVVLSAETDGDSRDCQLTIKYSNDGLMYSAFVEVDSRKASPGGKCSGKVDKFGNLERRECTPGDWRQRDIVGTVWAPKYDNVLGSSSGGCQWTDQKLLITKKRRSVAVAKAKATGEKKRRATEIAAQKEAKIERQRVEKRRVLAAAEEKRRDLAATKAKAAAKEKRRVLAAADKKRQEIAKKAAEKLAKERRLQKEMLSIKDTYGAKLFLKDFKEFVSKEPTVFDSFKMAELYGAAQELVSNGQYKSKKKTFQKLVEYANSNSRYRTYRMNKQLKRKQELKIKKNPVIDDIGTILVLLRKKVAADPLNPISSKVIRIVKTYEEKSLKGETLSGLVTILTNLSAEVRAVGIEPLVGTYSIANNSPEGGKLEISTGGFRTIPKLKNIKENDIVFLANVTSSSPHAYRDLNGDIKFEKSTMVICSPNTKNWDRQSLTFAEYKINGLYPKHVIKYGSCQKKIGSVDVIMARGVDLAKSKELPSEVAFAKGFRSKTLSILFTVRASDVSDEVKRRTILSSQYKNDIMEEARSGFGAISGDNSSSVSCVVVTDLRDAHQTFVDQAAEARAFQSGIETRKNVDVNLSNGFRQLQKKTCGLIYGGEKSLKKLIEASKNANLKVTVLPVWTSASKVREQAALLLNNQNTSEQSKADRLAALKRKLVEDAKQRAARAAELSQRQAQFRVTFGAKVTSLVAAIDTQLKTMRSKIDTALSEKRSVSAAVKDQRFWGELPGWYGAKRQKGWEFGSTVATPADYGTAIWKGRNIKAIVAKVRFLMKQPDLGEYSDTCWYVGYLTDTEFSRKREPVVASCKKPSALKNWFVVNRFKTQWDLGVR
jgi:hypothetical protein